MEYGERFGDLTWQAEGPYGVEYRGLESATGAPHVVVVRLDRDQAAFLGEFARRSVGGRTLSADLSASVPWFAYRAEVPAPVPDAEIPAGPKARISWWTVALVLVGLAAFVFLCGPKIIGDFGLGVPEYKKPAPVEQLPGAPFLP